MNSRLLRPAALVCALAALAACSDGAAPLGPDIATPAPAAPQRYEVACAGSVADHTVTCGRPDASKARAIIVGKQGTYVKLASSNVVVTPDSFTFDVTVQNLIPQPMGTSDGVTLDPAGVRVFYDVSPVATAGSGEVTVLHPDGYDAFTRANQPYYQWDQVLAQGQTSAPKHWALYLDPGVEHFYFTLYVLAPVPYPHGYVELSPPTPYLLAGGSQALSSLVRNAVGDTASTQAVTWGSSDAAVATVDAQGNVTALSPGRVTISAVAPGGAQGSSTIDVCPNLAVGQAYTAAMPLASQLCLGGQASTAEYVYMPVNLSTSSALSLTVTGTGVQAVTGPPAVRLPGPPSGLRGSADDGGSDVAIMERGVRETRRLVASPASAIPAPSARGSRGVRRTITPGVPAMGDLMSLNVAQGCSGTPDLRTGRVRTISQHAIIVSDTSNPAGSFTTAQYDSIALEFDSLSFKVDSTNFGAPTDMDGNGRIVLFYTRAINELSPPGTVTVTSFGSFYNRDVFSADPVNGCERSNAGEILYMMVPDPTGAVNGNTRAVGTVRGGLGRTHAHELQHLINAFRRKYVTGATSFEEPWLDEGLSQAAEELMFFRTAPGLAPRSNLVLSNINGAGPNQTRRVAAFNAYQNNNFNLFRNWLQRPDTTGAFATTNPDGSAFRGALGAFLRYASDRVNGSDAAFWQSLVNSNLVGKANLQNAIGADPNAWLRDFIAAMHVDDNSFTVAAAYKTPSWNYRSVYGGLGGFPLQLQPLPNGSPVTLSYSRGGATQYFRFGTAAGAFGSVTALSGGTVPTMPYALIVVRTK